MAIKSGIVITERSVVRVTEFTEQVVSRLYLIENIAVPVAAGAEAAIVQAASGTPRIFKISINVNKIAGITVNLTTADIYMRLSVRAFNKLEVER